jgi:cysteinyl-tRNA synthetase
MLKIFNDLTHKKEIFKVQDQIVKIYSCGPTVYDYVHIGNLRTFAFEDLLVRYLKYKGYKVIHVRNLTDVEDKIIKGLNNNPDKTLKEYTEFYINAFFADCKTLKLTDSSYYPRATEYVDKIVDFIYELIRKGYAYKSDDGSVYFSIAKFKDYGKLAQLDKRELKLGASGKNNSDEYSKDELNDFVLWKSYNPKDGKVFWETKLGKGRPGWHIECSVMSTSLLGNTLDIHSGGEDLAFPHHDNEIAQSEAHSGEPFARFWVHAKHLLVNNQKMSKSLGNFYTLRDLEKLNYNPLSLKLLYLSSHYKNQLNFTFDSLNVMQKNLNDINLLLAKLTNYYSETQYTEEMNNEIIKKSEEIIKNIKDALDDNFNSPLALTFVYDYVSYANSLISQGLINKKSADELVDYFKDIDSIFGIFTMPEKVPLELEPKLWERYNARKIKDFASSDARRKELDALGYTVADIPNGFTVVKK